MRKLSVYNFLTLNGFYKGVSEDISWHKHGQEEGEYAAEHVNDAYSKPLAYINDWVGNINPDEHFFLHCAGGYRSMIAASILQARGYRNFTEVEGGFNGIKKTEKVPTTDFVCQSKTAL